MSQKGSLGLAVTPGAWSAALLAERLLLFMRSYPSAWWLLTRLAPVDYWSGSRALIEVWAWAFVLFVLVLALIALALVGLPVWLTLG